MAHARLREEPAEQCKGLLAIHDALKERNRPDPAVLEAAGEIARMIRDPHDRAILVVRLAQALAEMGRTTEAEEVARAVQNPFASDRRQKALYDLAAVLAQTGRFADALTALGPRDLDEFLQILADWAPAFERVEPELSLAVLREATRVGGWVRRGWRTIHELLSAQQNGGQRAAEAQR